MTWNKIKVRLRIYSRWLTLTLCALAAIGCHGDAGPGPYPLDDLLRVNHIRMKGTHNSYHVAPPDPLPRIVPYLDYTHASLDVQLEEQGVRQFELDLRWDLVAGRFKVFHIPVVDQETTCYWFTDCLETIRSWSDDHPGHHPLFIFIEPKHELALAGFEGRYDDLDQEILSVWPRERLLTPDDLQGGSPTLAKAIEARGWPTLGETRGRAVFVLLDSGEHRTEYTYGNTTLEGRVMFVVAHPGNPFAAVVRISNADENAHAIRESAELGYIVRTYVDSPVKARAGDTAERDASLEAGAHILSTDFPAEGAVEGYWVEIPGGTPSGCNPITAPAACTSEAIEDPGRLGG